MGGCLKNFSRTRIFSRRDKEKKSTWASERRAATSKVERHAEQRWATKAARTTGPRPLRLPAGPQGQAWRAERGRQPHARGWPSLRTFLGCPWPAAQRVQRSLGVFRQPPPQPFSSDIMLDSQLYMIAENRSNVHNQTLASIEVENPSLAFKWWNCQRSVNTNREMATQIPSILISTSATDLMALSQHGVTPR